LTQILHCAQLGNVSVCWWSISLLILSPSSLFQLGASFSGQSDAEDMDLSDLRPDTPSVDSSPCTASTPIPSNQEAFPLLEETASTASSDSGKQPRLSNNPPKRKRVSDDVLELQKLDLLKHMVAQVDSHPPRDTLTSFGNQVALELRDIQNPVLLSQVKRSIMILIYNAQENDRSGSLSSPGQPTPHQPVNSGLSRAQSHSQHPYYVSGPGYYRPLLETQPEHAHE